MAGEGRAEGAPSGLGTPHTSKAPPPRSPDLSSHPLQAGPAPLSATAPGLLGRLMPAPDKTPPPADLARLTPMAMLRSQRYVSKPSDRSVSCTSETCEESMLCKLMPPEPRSQQASVMRSLRASSTRLSTEPCTSRASNILAALAGAAHTERNGGKTENQEKGPASPLYALRRPALRRTSANQQRRSPSAQPPPSSHAAPRRCLANPSAAPLLSPAPWCGGSQSPRGLHRPASRLAEQRWRQGRTRHLSVRRAFPQALHRERKTAITGLSLRTNSSRFSQRPGTAPRARSPAPSLSGALAPPIMAHRIIRVRLGAAMLRPRPRPLRPSRAAHWSTAVSLVPRRPLAAVARGAADASPA